MRRIWKVILGSAGARACPNLPQRRPGPVSAARRGAEYQRFFSCIPARSGSLWQIWTTGAAAGREGYSAGGGVGRRGSGVAAREIVG